MQLNKVSVIQKIIDNSHDLLCAINAEMQLVSISKPAAALLGYNKEELIGKYITDFIYQGDIELVVGRLKSILSGSANIDFGGRGLHKDASAVPVSWSVTWVPGDELLFCVIRDAALKKSMGESLSESQENYKVLFYSNPLPILIYDTSSLAILDINQMASDLYGYSREAFLKLTIKDIRPPEELPLLNEAIEKGIFTKEVKNLGTWTHSKKNGDRIKVEVVGHAMDYKGKDCMIVVCNDITEKLKALTSLEQSIERFEHVTEATTDIIWDWDLNTNEVYYSANIQKSFGHTPGINIGDMRFFAQHVHPDDRERVVLYPTPVKYGDMKYWSEKYRFRKANGEYAFVLDKGVVIRDENGVGIRMMGAMQDITELKNYEQHVAKQNDQLVEHTAKLNTLNTLKDRLIAILAHDLRAPLSSLRGLFDLFQDDSISNRELLEMIPSVVKKLDYTSDFLDTLLFWINTQMDNFEKSVRNFSVKEIVVKEKQNLETQAGLKGIGLVMNVSSKLTAWADPDSVRIVIRNLVTNAIKFSSEQDVIEVSAVQEDQNILIKVKDNGGGMTPEQAKKLFKSKVESQTGTHNESGTGMGLLFCKDLIEKCKGTIWVTSKKGIGTEFFFTIPTAKTNL